MAKITPPALPGSGGSGASLQWATLAISANATGPNASGPALMVPITADSTGSVVTQPVLCAAGDTFLFRIIHIAAGVSLDVSYVEVTAYNTDGTEQFSVFNNSTITIPADSGNYVFDAADLAGSNFTVGTHLSLNGGGEIVVGAGGEGVYTVQMWVEFGPTP